MTTTTVAPCGPSSQVWLVGAALLAAVFALLLSGVGSSLAVINPVPAGHAATRTAGTTTTTLGATPYDDAPNPALATGADSDRLRTDKRPVDDVQGPFLALSGGLVAPQAILKTPEVSSTRLQNIINNLYKGTTNPARVGTGTTMDAVRFELSNPGAQVFGRSHIIKAEESLAGLENWLKANQTAPWSERLIARSLADDLLDSLGRSR